MMKIAVIKSGAIGDVLMTTPFLRGLRNTFPDAEIVYVTGKWSLDAIRGNADINRIIAFDQNSIFGSLRQKIKLLKLLKKMRSERFDVCFVLDKSWLAGVFAWLCAIPDRVGFARGWEGFAHTKTVKYERVKHEIQYYLDMLVYFTKEACGTLMNMHIGDDDMQYARDLVRDAAGRKLIAMSLSGGNPGQSSASRDWAAENYQRMAAIAETKGWKVVCLGSKGMEGRNVYNLAGKTSLKEAAAVLRECSLLVCGDSGLMHVAAAVGTPVLSIFGPTDPRRKAPLDRYSAWLWRGSDCTKCELYGRYCKNHPSPDEITVEEAASQLERMV
ncbi:MAG: glycosyltransferase family 9 protein [Candidatus Aenigmarchaeota archaeon]|nr:glycosyltransferase family 9 protein [Candidatus Aenigmarchaeota archaeon]